MSDLTDRLTAERDAALQASKWESDLCGQALEDRQASETKYAAACDELDRLRVTVKMLQDDRDTAQKLLSDATQALGRMEVERDALRERVAGLERTLGEHIVAADAKIHEMATDNAALRADAERYRWLRLPGSNVPISHDAARDPLVYDAAIDAARAALKGEAS